jgi:LacI family transcriptional regulator
MSTSNRPPSILDVAKAAGVGVGTVSRAINNRPSVSKEAMKAVRRAMALLNYSPPPPGRRRGYRAAGTKPSRPSGKLGEVTIIILAEYGIDWVLRKAPVYASVLHGVQSMVEAKGGVLAMRQAKGWAQLLTAVQQSKGSPCLIMGEEPPGEPPSQLRHAAVVWVMGSVRRFEGDHVQPDHFSLGQMAALHVLGRGHRSAAYLGEAVSPLRHVSMRGVAFQWWLESEGAEVTMLVDSAIISSGPDEHQANEKVLNRLLDRFCALAPRPTALLLQADILAPHIYNLLRERRVRPMEDLEILTCNREQAYLSHLKPQPVTLDLQAEAIGRRAVEQLLWRVTHPNEAAMRVMIEPLLIVPETLANGSDSIPGARVL